MKKFLTKTNATIAGVLTVLLVSLFFVNSQATSKSEKEIREPEGIMDFGETKEKVGITIPVEESKVVEVTETDEKTDAKSEEESKEVTKEDSEKDSEKENFKKDGTVTKEVVSTKKDTPAISAPTQVAKTTTEKKSVVTQKPVSEKKTQTVSAPPKKKVTVTTKSPKPAQPKVASPKKEVSTSSPKKEVPKTSPKKDDPKKETPKVTPPKKETPKKEEPKKEVPKEEPKKETPKEEPKKEEPKVETPKLTLPAAPAGETGLMNAILAEVNKERAKVGVPALKSHSGAQKVALIRAKDMADNNYYGHVSPTYGSYSDMLNLAGISRRAGGENILYGYSAAQAVVQGWMESPGHKKNILNPDYTHTGVGTYAGGQYGLYHVQIFITP